MKARAMLLPGKKLTGTQKSGSGYFQKDCPWETRNNDGKAASIATLSVDGIRAVYFQLF